MRQKHDLDLLLTLSREQGIHLGVAAELLDTTQSDERLKEAILDSMAKQAIETITVYQEDNTKTVPRAAIRLPQEDLARISRAVNENIGVKPETYQELYAYADSLKRDVQLQLAVELAAAIENSFLETAGLENYLLPFQKEDKRHLLEILAAHKLQPEKVNEVKSFIQAKGLSEHRLIANIIKILEQIAATPTLEIKKRPASLDRVQVNEDDLRQVVDEVVHDT
ncbi:MAG: hypothetical protein AAB956_03145 [Patescibacteria group bacterium]